MTLRVRALSEEEAPRLARMTRSQKLGAGLVRRAQIIQHAVDGLSAPEIAARMGLCGATVSIGKEPGPRSASNRAPCSPTGASWGGTAFQLRFLKRQLSLPVSMMSQ